MKRTVPESIIHARFGSIGIDYDEPDPNTYRAVKIRTRDVKGKQVQTKSFASGDANYDYHCAMLWLDVAGCETIMGSSSCDHFQMDGGTIDLEVAGLKKRLRAYHKSIGGNKE